jgi:hypothetical protein
VNLGDLRAALASSPVVVRNRLPVAAARGLKHLADVAPKIADTEARFPATKQVFDDAVVQATKYYVPMFGGWRDALAEIDGWEEKVAGGPGFAGDCAARLQGQLQRYLSSVVPAAKADALADAFRDPVGYHLANAIGICAEANGDPDTATEISVLVKNADQVRGFHSAISSLVRRNITDGKYKDRKVGASFEAMGNGTSPAEHVNYGKGYALVEEQVAAVKGQTITFVHREKTWDRSNCTYNYNVVDSIDKYGNVHYQVVDCQWSKMSEDATLAPVTLPSPEAANVRAGDQITVMNVGINGSDNHLLFIRRGANPKALDLVWAAGFTAGK